MSNFYFSRRRSKAPAEEKNFKLKSIGAAQKYYSRTASATPTLASITHRLYEEKDDEREQLAKKD